MSNIGQVSPSLEDYVEVIFDLLKYKGIARVKDVADSKAVSMASVNNALKRLVDKGLIKHESYGYITLTEDGESLAKQLEARHKIIRNFLEDILNIDSKIADEDACTIEHHVHKKTIDALIKYVGRLKSGASGTYLHNVDSGKNYEIEKINVSGEIKHRLMEMGLHVGEKVRVERVAPLGDPIDIKIKNYHLSLRKEEAAHIKVKELGR